ncbi:MAG TPA: hypothetical protein VGN78_11730 [Solirubrobacteraceae bacterium]|nr:hypothetical protein [Solirubrobacteraceae bacterium]
MSIVLYLILIAITGLFVGALGRLAIPGRDPMTLTQTMLVGVAGSLAAGLLSLVIFHGRHGGGILLSVLFAAGIVYLIRRFRQRQGVGSPPSRRPVGR